MQSHSNGHIQHPQRKGDKPPFPQKRQPQPGQEKDMNPKPDYGVDSYVGTGKLKDKTAIITGADSGIGRAVALAYAREGADVIINYNQSDDDAKETLQAIESADGKAILFKADIRDEVQCQNMVDRALQEFGKVDILINNAAFQESHNSILEITSDEIDKTFKTNIYPMFYLAKAALPHMKEGGSIINTASIQAYQPTSNLIAYATTKGAIVTFTKALSEEAIEKGIRVNAVAPGPVWTPLIPASMDDEVVQNFGKQVPMKRPAQPAELAPLYVFLASQDASYVTGQVYGITGGQPLI
jgi:NAD(P)-dependent dehydrogenase (short-subunit alcohol dehydrogenase family)